MTRRELGKVAKIVGSVFPECGVSGHMLVRVPLSPILRAICLESSSAPRGFYVWVFFQPLCIPKAMSSSILAGGSAAARTSGTPTPPAV